jgi:methylmalonyl-CoA mutase N-terminal domain/subunit
MGGALGALDKGFQIREIHNSAYLLQQQVERGDRIVVGVNAYQTENPPIANIQRIDPEQTRGQLTRLAKVKADRNGEAVQAALARLKAVAEGTDNTMPSILEAVEAYATVGEIADTFRSVFGEQREFAPF